MVNESIREISTTQFLTERQAILDPTHRALFDLLFLTGTRISEVVRIIKPSDIDISNFRATFHTLKNKKDTHRTVGFLPRSGEFAKVIEELGQFISSHPVDAILFGLSRQTAWEYCWKYFNCTDHSFRHSNAIIASRDYRMPPENLRVRYGWSGINSAAPYLKYQTDEHTERLIEEREKEIYGTYQQH